MGNGDRHHADSGDNPESGAAESTIHGPTAVAEPEYRTIFEGVEDAIFIFDVERDDGELSFSFRENNPAHEAKTGMGSGEWRGASPREIMGSKAGSEIAARYRDCVEKREAIEYDETLDHPTGTVEWHTKLTPIEEDGEVTRIVGISRDITKRKKRERELKRRETFLESSSDMVTVIDEEGTITYESPAVKDILGYEPADLVGESVFDFIHPEDIDSAIEEFETKLEPGETHKSEVRVQNSDGEWRWIELRGRVHLEDPAIEGVVVTSSDITERKEHERELRRYEAFIENSPTMVTLLDTDGTVLLDKTGVELEWRHPSETFLDENVFEFIHPEDHAAVREVMEALRTNPEVPQSVEFRFQGRDGDWRWLRSSAVNHADDPRIGGIIVVSIDITDRKRHEEGLATLHESTRDIIEADSKIEIAEIAVEAAHDLLEFALPAVWYPTEDGSALAMVANSEEHQALLEEAGTPEPEHPREDWFWDLFEAGETAVRSPVSRDKLAADVPLQSVIILPLGDHGVLTCAAKGEKSFTDRQIAVAEILAGNIRVALDQLAQHADLANQKQFTDDLLDAIEDIAYVIEPDGNIRDWNEALETVTGYDSDEIESMALSDFFPEENVEMVKSVVEETFETGESRTEVPIQTAEGELIPYEFIAHAFEDPDGEPVIAGIGRDRSLHVQYENRLKAQRDDLKRTIESLPYPFYVLDAEDYSIEYANSRAMVSQGETCYEVTHGRDRPCDEGDDAEIPCPLSTVLESGEPRTVEHVHQGSDGEKRVYDVFASPIIDNDGNITRIAESTIDITERVTYERQLETQRDSLELLNQVVRHDIRNDMNVLQGHAELLRDSIETDGDQHLKTVLETTAHAIELTKTARDLSETMLSTEEDVEPVRLSPHLEDPISNTRSKFNDAALTVEDRIPDVYVRGNELLEAVFRNILQNAVVHNDSAVPRVRVSTTLDTETVTVSIADNGPGIPDEQKEAIFGKGAKGLDSPGTGVGLYLVQTLVEQFGGSVWVEDNDPTGSVFHVELPLAEDQQ